LLIVDVQRCFINPYTAHIPGRIARLVSSGDYSPLLFTRFVNVPGSPYRRFLQWNECESSADTELVPELAPFAQADRVYSKPGLAGMSDELKQRLRADGTERLTVVGIDTDMCVLKVALDAFDMGVEPILLVDCCASTAGLQAHLAGLAVLSRNLGPHQLRDAGLSGGYVAPP